MFNNDDDDDCAEFKWIQLNSIQAVLVQQHYLQ